MKMLRPNIEVPFRSANPNRRLPAHALRKVALPTQDGYIFKRVEHIILLEADGNYTTFHFTDGAQVVVCKTLRHTEELLGAYPQFVRIHRSYTINLNHLERYIRGKGGYAVMENGRNISISNSKKADFLKALEYYFGQQSSAAVGSGQFSVGSFQ